MKKILKIVVLLLGIVVLGIAGLLTYVKMMLPQAPPAEALTIPVTPARLERGKYLAHHVMLCMDCHSVRDYSKFAAPMKPGTLGGGGEAFVRAMGFPGDFYSTNLTPHHLQDWTDGELFRAITTGVSRDGRALFPLMPYLNYGQLDKEDVYDVIAYIRTLEPVVNDTPPRDVDFPMNFIINTIPQPAKFVTRPQPSDVVAYGKYMLTAANCDDCHTVKDKGTPVPGMYLAGGFEVPFPDGTRTRSANITPDNETGIGQWTEAQFVNRFRAYSDSSYVAHDVKPGEFKTFMPWTFYSQMKDEDLKAIYAYLRTVPPVNHAVTKFEPASQPPVAALH